LVEIILCALILAQSLLQCFLLGQDCKQAMTQLYSLQPGNDNVQNLYQPGRDWN